MSIFTKAVSVFAAIASILLTGCVGGETAQTTEPAQTAIVSETASQTETAEEKGAIPVRTAEELAGKKVIALTFDDGPNTAVTDELLDIFEEYGIKASFYVVGQNITPETGKVMQRAHALGCEINNHSFTHSFMDKMTAEEIKDEIKRTDELVYEYVGEYPKFFRPPYIAVSDTMYKVIDLPFICGLGCNDWEDKVSEDDRYRFLTEKCPDGCIVLLHDQPQNTKTLEAVRRAVPELLKAGFEFVTTEELFIAKGVVPVSDGVIYSYASEKGYTN